MHEQNKLDRGNKINAMFLPKVIEVSNFKEK